MSRRAIRKSEAQQSSLEGALLEQGSEVGRTRPCAVVVDDDPEVRRALTRWLGLELDVHSAASAAEATALLETMSRVDIAFVDFELPDASGERILEQLHRWPDAIRVLISGHVVEGESPLENRALANLVLKKPLGSEVIAALTRATVGLSLG